jgi:hypothetical protein
MFDLHGWLSLFNWVLKTAPEAMIQRCAAFVNAHISINMLRFPKRRPPWLMA